MTPTTHAHRRQITTDARVGETPGEVVQEPLGNDGPQTGHDIPADSTDKTNRSFTTAQAVSDAIPALAEGLPTELSAENWQRLPFTGATAIWSGPIPHHPQWGGTQRDPLVRGTWGVTVLWTGELGSLGSQISALRNSHFKLLKMTHSTTLLGQAQTDSPHSHTPLPETPESTSGGPDPTRIFKMLEHPTIDVAAKGLTNSIMHLQTMKLSRNHRKSSTNWRDWAAFEWSLSIDPAAWAGRSLPVPA